jgi:hypothetical protein
MPSFLESASILMVMYLWSRLDQISNSYVFIFVSLLAFCFESRRLLSFSLMILSLRSGVYTFIVCLPRGSLERSS